MRDIVTLDSCGSTNTELLRLAAEDWPEGRWLRGLRQTGGRGRQGRSWDGGEGNLFASGLVRVRPGDPAAPGLALVAGLAVHCALSERTPDIGLMLKWPNDVVTADGAKLVGILLERAGDAVVIGVGVNVAQHPILPDRPTTSLHMLGDTGAEAGAVLEGIAACFAEELDRWRTGGIAAIAPLWTARAHPPGTALRCQLPDGRTVEGAFDRLDETGALVLRLAGGGFDVMHAGDVFLV